MVSKPKRFLMTGGIGNQLFQYTAGMYYSISNNETVNFDYATHHRRKPHQGSDIRELNLNGNFVNYKYEYILKKITEKLPFNNHLNPLNTYVSSGVGYDIKLESKISQDYVFGYFQTYKYLEATKVLTQLNRIASTRDNTWLEANKKIISEVPTIGIHIRKGDYVKVKSTIGNLAFDYFKNAVDLILNLSKNHFEQILVFSDDIKESQIFLKPFVSDLRIHFIESSSELVLENLILMSQVNALIIPNSTYSWWAAQIGKTSKIVVSPSKWFRNGDDPIDLIPNNWLKQESIWEI